jgi:tetratricopeptide (TPR) repeat protein
VARTKQLAYALELGRQESVDDSLAAWGEDWLGLSLMAIDLGLPEAAQFVLDRAAIPLSDRRTRVSAEEQRALLAFHAGDFVKAVAAAKRAMAFSEARSLYPFYPTSAWLQYLDLALAGAPEAALARAAELSAEAKRDPETVVDALGGEGFLWFAARRWEPAIASLRADYENPVSRRHRSANATIGAYLGAALVESGRLSEAIEPLESAQSWYEENSDGFDPAAPMAQLSLARVLWETNADRSQARLLASLARDGYARLGKYREVERQAAIRWLDSHPAP